MKKLLIITNVLVSLFFASCEKDNTNTISNNQADKIALESQQAVTAGYTLIFEDQFNDNVIDEELWELTNREDYNSSKCKYRPSRNSIENLDGADCLRISAKENGDEYISGHVKSRTLFHPKTNEEIHIKSRIKFLSKDGSNFRGFDQTSGVWPAFWTVNENQWPTKGEIDIMEGYSFGNSDTDYRFASNMFYGRVVNENEIGTKAESEWKNFNINGRNGWHTYEMFWENKNGDHTIKIVIDGTQRALFNKKTAGKKDGKYIVDFSKFTNHSVIFNLNVGSNDDINIFGDNPTELFDETNMFVDYVVVEKKNI